MEPKRYSITLANGFVIKDLRKNGTNYISDNPIDSSIFEGNCSPVIISDGEEADTHEHMALGNIRERGGKYWFTIRDISDQELAAIQYAASIRYLSANMADTDAVNCIDLFPVWSSNSKSYHVGDRVRYGKQLYKCMQAHASQSAWSPVAASSLWTRVDDPSVEWPEWIQPTGAHDAYYSGYKVSHNGVHWVSDADNNVWEPGVYGWTEQV